MKLLGILFLSLVLFALSCENDAKLGDNCTLLKEAKENITKIEEKNLDCITLDQNAMCVSYQGNPSYCTQKCGPKRTCYDEKTKKGDVICGINEVCIDAYCYDAKKACSAENKEGLCPEGKKCNEDGFCKSICKPTEVYIKGKCAPKNTLCSPQNPTGICDSGLKCSEKGVCEPVGCPEGYDCISPIKLQGHPLKGVYVCVKSEETESSPCKGISCSYQGVCKIDSSGKPGCICNSGFKPSEDKLDCVAQ